MKIAVCDDDNLFVQQTGQAVQEWAQERELSASVFSFDNGDSLLNAYAAEKFDILLLDIMMPLFTGMELAHAIREIDAAAKIIFLTSSPEFAVESYEVKASGYLLKPLQKEKLHSVLDDCVAPPEGEPEHVIIRTSHGYHKIYLHDIECLEAQNKKVIFHLTGGEARDALGTFSNYAEALTMENGFFKCHRSYIVSIPQVDYFNATELRTRTGILIPIARSYSKTFKETYFAYMFQKETHHD